MKTNSKNIFEVTCGGYRHNTEIDREIFESYENACFEAATQSLESYFYYSQLEEKEGMEGLYPETDMSLGIFCLIRQKDTQTPPPPSEHDFIILTHHILRNAGDHHLANEFERASDSYLSAINKKEK